MTASRPPDRSGPPPSWKPPAIVVRVVGALSTAWLIVGVSVLLLITLEIGYRAQGAVRRALRGEANETPVSQSPLHPNFGTDWWSEYTAESGWVTVFDPYRGIWADSTSGPYLNIDALGRRVTYDPTPQAEAVRHVWMFGGSAMWGYLVRDRHTIPSLVAEELDRRGVEGVRVLNLAQSTFNLTQGVATLVLELRAGRTPDVVVFMDGNNEVAPPYQSGRVGTILNQDRLGERLRGPPPGLTDWLWERLTLVQRLARVESSPGPGGGTSLCPDIAQHYANLTDVVRGLGAYDGFATRFYWQPMLAISEKPRTQWEERITQREAWGEMVSVCTRAVDDSMLSRGYDDYRSLGGLFDAESESVFIDDFGHMTESANAVVARAIADDLIPLLLVR